VTKSIQQRRLTLDHDGQRKWHERKRKLSISGQIPGGKTRGAKGKDGRGKEDRKKRGFPFLGATQISRGHGEFVLIEDDEGREGRKQRKTGIEQLSLVTVQARRRGQGREKERKIVC